MPPATPTLHLLCGKIAAGKSTLAARIAAETGAQFHAFMRYFQPPTEDEEFDIIRHAGA